MEDEEIPLGPEQERERVMELVEIGELQPYPANPRTHPPAQIERIARSIQAFGFTVPLLTDGKGEVIAGHGRLLAARHLGLARVPVIRLADLTPAQARAYRIADNQLTLLGDWDTSLLTTEIGELALDGFDLELLGFAEEELERFASPAVTEDPDPPEDFAEYDEDIETEHRCPKCGYEWSGKPA